MIEQTFRAALLDPMAPVPAGLSGPGGTPAASRFAIYRNNVTVGLIRALEAGFPVVRALLGEKFFAAMAGEFARAHAPASPRMMHYGAALPGFVESFPPVAHLPYLADVARLEQAIRESYHAADAAPVPVARLAALPPERLMAARLCLAPALRVLSSPHPVHAIWLAHQHSARLPPRTGSQDVVITRPDFDPIPNLLPPGGYAFLLALADGASVLAAAEMSHCDRLAELIGLLLTGGAISGLIEDAE